MIPDSLEVVHRIFLPHLVILSVFVILTNALRFGYQRDPLLLTRNLLEIEFFDEGL